MWTPIALRRADRRPVDPLAGNGTGDSTPLSDAAYRFPDTRWRSELAGGLLRNGTAHPVSSSPASCPAIGEIREFEAVLSERLVNTVIWLIKRLDLVITGREKDMIIIHGRNIWPQDIEYLAECSPR